MKGKLIKKLCAVGLSALMLMGAGVVWTGSPIGASLTVNAAQYVTESGFGYVYHDDLSGSEDGRGATITGYEGSETNIVIPETVDGYKVTGISWRAFEGNTDITSVTIPSSVTVIEEAAFVGCTSLTSVTISNGVTTIGDYAFSGCTSLATITIPSSVTSIGWGAFEETAWYDSQPNGLVYAGNVAYEYKGEMSYGTHITLKKNTKGIADDAFAGCSGLTSITIPDSLTTIGEYAFLDCTSLTSITIPDGVTSIERFAFYGCDSLTSVTIPYCLEYIGDYTFQSCDRLVSVIIPNGETSFSQYAFYLCNNVTIYGKKGSRTESSASYYGETFKELGFINTSYISARRIVDGDTLTVPCNAAYGTGPYTYAVYYQDVNGSIWKKAQDYSSNTSVSFKFNDPGHTYTVLVKAKDQYGKISKATFEVTVNGKLKNKSRAASDSIKLGEKITIYGGAAGGIGYYDSAYKCYDIYLYEIWYKQESATKWTKKQSYSTNHVISFKPKAVTTYDISVKVKDHRGVVVKKRFKVKVNDNSLQNTSTVEAENISLGEYIRINCSAQKGSGDYTYAVWYKKSSATSWTTKQNYSTNRFVSIKPSSRTTYNVSVKVKDSNGNISKKTFNIKVQ